MQRAGCCFCCVVCQTCSVCISFLVFKISSMWIRSMTNSKKDLSRQEKRRYGRNQEKLEMFSLKWMRALFRNLEILSKNPWKFMFENWVKSTNRLLFSWRKEKRGKFNISPSACIPAPQRTIPKPHNKEPPVIVLALKNTRCGSVCGGMRDDERQPHLGLIRRVSQMWCDGLPNQTGINTFLKHVFSFWNPGWKQLRGYCRVDL